uniref:FXYD domain-containing ion transport regulator n=1 Tax=Oncorhynchus tshawytscha TaxID=74940 RepID=A0AAZ3SQT2_ONCTS
MLFSFHSLSHYSLSCTLSCFHSLSHYSLFCTLSCFHSLSHYSLSCCLSVSLSLCVCSDYHRLRVGGLILAAVLCLIGITILFSGHCRCKFNQDKRRRSGSNAAQPLNDQARASEC